MTSLAEALRPAALQDEFTAWMLKEDGGGYIGARRLPDGSYAGVLRLAFTYGLCLGVDRGCPATKRYCFEHIYDCLIAFEQLTSSDDEPVGWVASRPKQLEEDWNPVVTAPRDGTIIRMANFAFGHCHYCRSAAYQNGEWIEVDSSREGQPLKDPTHWLP
jgi:hypothetical protein